MPDTTRRKLFVNIAVRDLKKSMDFFSALGFTFNAKFTDEKAACMIVNDDAYFMLLTEPFMKGFMRREICDTKTQTEALLAVFFESRATVDDLVDKALAAGATEAADPQDHGFMYARSFHDLDGHHWEIGWMDPAAAQ